MFADNPLDEMYFDWYMHPEYNHGDNAAFYQHMPTLRHMCHGKTVLELGARYGTSTLAILAARPTQFISCDIEKRTTVAELERLAAQENIPFYFFECDDMQLDTTADWLDIRSDIVFIDTLHTYEQLRKELFFFHHYAKEYIVMHDLVSFAHVNEDGNTNGPQGLIPAMEEFLDAHLEWTVDSFYFNCNGLMIFRRA